MRRDSLLGDRRAPLADGGLSPLFAAVIDATEEAIVNSLLRAETVRGHAGTARAVPIARVRELLERGSVIPRCRIDLRAARGTSQ